MRHFERDFFAKENQVEFAIEALLFGTPAGDLGVADPGGSGSDYGVLIKSICGQGIDLLNS